tara:strand:- start:326 stop:643 length:318 start_codon:yes stop_codon:yes gene_type:complete
MKSFQDLREVRILRTASALAFATKVRNARQKSEQNSKNIKTILNRLNANDTELDRSKYLADAVEELSLQLVNVANQVSSLSAICTTTLITNERSNKQLLKLIKQR